MVCFGKAAEWVAGEEQRLLPRIRGWQSLEIVELKESTQREIPRRLAAERDDFVKKFGWPAGLVVLDERGETPDSPGLAKMLGEAAEQGWGELTFVIGSAYGLDPEFAQRARRKLALSKLTLTHDYARVLLVEQLWRGLCIQRGHPYHHV